MKNISRIKNKISPIKLYLIKSITIFFALILLSNNGISQTIKNNKFSQKIGCKGYTSVESRFQHYFFVDEYNNLTNIGSLLKAINKIDLNEYKVYDKWLFKENRDGIKIYYKWITDKNYMELKLDNTNIYGASISFHPLVYCWKCIDNTSNKHTDIYINPNSSKKFNINIKCENLNETDMVLEKLVIY